MPTRIAEYYIELQRREGLEPIELVGDWDQNTPDRISQSFRSGIVASRLFEQQIPLRERSSNQSVGNQVADFFVPAINAHLQGYRIDPCSGGGYPDKILVEIASGRTFAFELKATSTWDENDSNRRVLTSSSRKLRQRFGGAANHILATILYSTENLEIRRAFASTRLYRARYFGKYQVGSIGQPSAVDSSHTYERHDSLKDMVLNIPSSRRVECFGNNSTGILCEELRSFRQFNGATKLDTTSIVGGQEIPTFTNEFWTSKQRAANRLHEISYRACFKPQLPRFFIERLTKPGDIVFDPFMGRGTTLLEAALLGRIPSGCDVNPLCQKLIAPRLNPPTILEVKGRLAEINFDADAKMPKDLLAFYHPQTLQQICALRSYFLEREKSRLLDLVDEWIRMVALNRLTGHSPGFFSVYTMPPNQAVSIESQLRINKRLGQKPEFRSVPDLILAKTKSLIGNLSDAERKTLRGSGAKAEILVRSCELLPEISDNSINLVVTSPPFLNVVDYASDNWLRNWFVGLDENAAQFVIHKKLADWEASMGRVLLELHRILQPGGWIAFEVGEIQRGKIQLEDSVISAGIAAGLEPELVLINSQQFTKTANCWGVRNNDLGTNTNRVVLFKKTD